jgi:hypothetical protein
MARVDLAVACVVNEEIILVARAKAGADFGVVRPEARGNLANASEVCLNRVN